MKCNVCLSCLKLFRYEVDIYYICTFCNLVYKLDNGTKILVDNATKELILTRYYELFGKKI